MAVRFGKDARRVAQRSRDVARERGSRTVEAEHLLLALTERRAGVACACLGDAGLDREGMLRALEEEAARSLAAAGVTREAFDLPPPRSGPSTPRWGASAKLALQRTLRAALARGDRAIGRARHGAARHGRRRRGPRGADRERRGGDGREGVTVPVH